MPILGSFSSAKGRTLGATFTASDTNHAHQDRGLVDNIWGPSRTPITDCDSDIAAGVAAGRKLFHQYVDLSPYTGTDTIPGALLTNIATNAGYHRTRKTRCIIRFFYNFDGSSGDVSLARFEAHADQLGPVITAAKDTIAYCEAGFIGQYGEWWSGGSSTLVNHKTAVKDKLLATWPSDRFLMFRYPYDMDDWHASAPTDMTTAISRRMGCLNDAWMGGNNDGATFSIAGTLAYWQSYSSFAPMGGETDDLGSLTSQRTNWAARGPQEHWNHFRFENDRTLFYDWLATQNNPETGAVNGGQTHFNNALGFWLEHHSFFCRSRAARGGALPFTLNIRNRGWSRVFLKKRLRLVLVPQGGGGDVPIDVPQAQCDPREWGGQQAAGTYHTVSTTVTVPAGTGVGAYDVHVALADDDYPTDKDYNIRPGNSDAGNQQWDSARGSWKTGLAVTVT